VKPNRGKLRQQKAKAAGTVPIFDDDKFNEMKKLMRMSPTIYDTAAFFECAKTTIEDEIKLRTGLTFSEFRDQFMVHTRMGLKRKCIEKAMQGDNTMLIWCTKNICGWEEKPQAVVEINNTNASAIIQTDLKERIKQLKGET